MHTISIFLGSRWKGRVYRKAIGTKSSLARLLMLAVSICSSSISLIFFLPHQYFPHPKWPVSNQISSTIWLDFYILTISYISWGPSWGQCIVGWDEKPSAMTRTIRQRLSTNGMFVPTTHVAVWSEHQNNPYVVNIIIFSDVYWWCILQSCTPTPAICHFVAFYICETRKQALNPWVPRARPSLTRLLEQILRTRGLQAMI